MRPTCYRHPGVEGLVSGGLLQLGRALGGLGGVSTPESAHL